jgi:multidrug transporter EmrE-like cation transporter
VLTSKPTSEYLLLTLIAVGLVVSQLLLKHGMKDQAVSINGWPEVLALLKHVFTTWTLLLGYVISGVMTLFWLVALSRMELSFALPTMNGIFYALLLLSSAVLLRESITLWRLSGIILLVGGIVLLARSR